MALSKQLNDLNNGWLEKIAESIEGLKYGHVQIIIHDGRIVQIDRLERRRFDQPEESGTSKKAIRK